MAQNSMEKYVGEPSHENSVSTLSTKEFLELEKSCEKDSDDEIKSIFQQIKKLSGAKSNVNNNIVDEELDDVELILKKAEELAQETQSILKSGATISKHITHTQVSNVPDNGNESVKIPVIKVTRAKDIDDNGGNNRSSSEVTKNNQHTKQNVKEVPNEPRKKQKTRPFSASCIDSKKRDPVKVSRFISPSPKKTLNSKHESLLEELKDTNERMKSLELLNVQLNQDNKVLRKNLEQVNEEKHKMDLKFVECEKFISRLGKEYENRNTELKTTKETENRLLAEMNKERNERKNLEIQHEKDMIILHDLQRQCKEMEMILKRKHPDSVSALIVAAKSSSVEDNKKKLLEERIARLELELKDKENHFQNILLTLQEKFGDMKQKYESHIIDVERQLMDDRKTNVELKNKLTKSNLISQTTQTEPSCSHSIGTQTVLRPSERASSAVSRMTQNSSLLLNKLKEDSYLVATIKGLQAELTAKQRTIAKINRETEELRKNLRSLQKEKEVFINLNPHKRNTNRHAKSSENILAKVHTEMEAELTENKKQREVLVQERNSLLESLKRTNEEFILLKKKRIQDLHTLQLSHEKELMQMNMQIYPLQEEIQVLNRTVDILQDRLRNCDEKLMHYHEPEINGGGDNGNGKNIYKKNAH